MFNLKIKWFFIFFVLHSIFSAEYAFVFDQNSDYYSSILEDGLSRSTSVNFLQKRSPKDIISMRNREFSKKVPTLQTKEDLEDWINKVEFAVFISINPDVKKIDDLSAQVLQNTFARFIEPHKEKVGFLNVNGWYHGNSEKSILLIGEKPKLLDLVKEFSEIYIQRCVLIIEKGKAMILDYNNDKKKLELSAISEGFNVTDDSSEIQSDGFTEFDLRSGGKCYLEFFFKESQVEQESDGQDLIRRIDSDQDFSDKDSSDDKNDKKVKFCGNQAGSIISPFFRDLYTDKNDENNSFYVNSSLASLYPHLLDRSTSPCFSL